MKNPFEREIKLRQHTPIIHFQHDQPGATLRATELKPKFDKFIVKHHFKGEFEEYKKYLVGFKQEEYDNLSTKDQKEYREKYFALDYKVTVSRPEKDVNKIDIKIFTDYKTGIYSNSIYNIKIFSFNSTLLEIIEKVKEDFFIVKNFGLAQSKGFGGFVPENINQKEFETRLFKYYPIFYKKELRGNFKNYKDIYKSIKDEYQLLKSGINKPYEKSKLFEFMCDKNINWEKRKIKETLKEKHRDVFDVLLYDKNVNRNRILACDNLENDDGNFRYIRALLGLAEHNEYRTFDSVKENKLGIEKVKIKIKDPENEIQRFQSPIFFKVFNRTIYILPYSVSRKMYNRIFKFSMELKYRKPGEKGYKEHLFGIPTPQEKDFDLVAFLDFGLSKDNGWIKKEKK